MFRFRLAKSAVITTLGIGLTLPCCAADSLLFVNRINLDKTSNAKYADVDVKITVDGQNFGDCSAESDAHVICEGAIKPGKHRVMVQVKGGRTLAKTINIRTEDAAMHWAGVPDDTRLWCVSVTKTSLALALKSECWDVENAR